MKKLILTLSITLIALFFIACPPGETDPAFDVTETSLTFSNDPDGADTYELTFDLKAINTNESVDYEITTTADWLTIDPTSGTVGTVAKTVTVTVNDDPAPTEDKTDTITITETTSVGLSDIDIDATFTYTAEKDDVWVGLIEASDSFGGTSFLYVDDEGSYTLLDSPTGSQYYDAGYIEYDYDFGTETGTVYVYGDQTDWSDNDSLAIWVDGVYNDTLSSAISFPDGATEADMPANPGGHNGIVKKMAVVDGTLHLLVWASGTSGMWTHYWDGDDYPTLPAPTSGNNVELHGVKEVDGKVLIYGYEVDGGWASHELKPIVYVNDGGSITLYEGFPPMSDIAGVMDPSHYRDFSSKDVTIASDGTILYVAFFGQGDDPYDDADYYYYTGIFKSDGTYESVGPNDGVYHGYSGTDDQPMMAHIASESDYIRIFRGSSREDDVYLDCSVATMEEPEYYEFDDTYGYRAIGWARMQSDGEDVYSFGDHQHHIDGDIGGSLTDKAVMYRNTKIVYQANTVDIGGNTYESFSSSDADIPQKPAQ